MQQKHLVTMLTAATLALAGHHVQAQQAAATATPAPLTRAQVKMEREDFIKSHRWDEASETWVLKEGFEPPAPMKGRAEVRKERDEFLRNNRWDTATGRWIPLVQPRVMAQLSRDQVKKETREFLRTHEWDEATEAWTLKRRSR
jgi:hypothetical protein